jgi:hypothetical protein
VGGGEERANMWGPHVSDKGERSRCGRKAQTDGETAFTERHHGTRRAARPPREAMAREGEWASAAAWADWAKNKGEFKIRFDFQISMDFWNLARL